ncbi:MAG TPA: DUF389 domain-containing protein [Anaerolineae bacterium]|nr:DUF389 domain-containing protein [Anaerolineae bacterium]HMR64675.1 DUF389 domain-containing protein [Anaerolineae bacterium]
MRQLLIQVPEQHAQAVLDVAKACHGVNLAQFPITNGGEGSTILTIIHVSNSQVENVLASLQTVPDLHITLTPRGVITLYPPPEQAADQVTDVEFRSPIEIFLAGLQSIGSWQGFLGYAVAAGIVVWTGLVTNTSYLLIAAMLIAPFAGPAMNTAIATARGDWYLFYRSLFRYIVALAVTIAVTAGLSLVFQQEIATSLTVSVSQVSSVAVLLPLVAGAAGALNLTQSQRSSLVSGAAVGLLVAASLAPPAGVVGIALVLNDGELIRSGLFVLALQLVGINLAGAITFRGLGLSAEGSRYDRGRHPIFWGVLSTTAVALAVLLTWQFWTQPDLQRSTRAERATTVVQQTVQNSELAKLVESNVRFTRARIEGQNTLLIVVYVQRNADVAMPAADIRAHLTEAIQSRLLEAEFEVTPLVEVIVLEAPPA